MIRWLIILVFGGALAYCGATVNLGSDTFFGHIRSIWKSKEMDSLKKDVKEGTGPAARRVEHGVEEGIKAMKDVPDGGTVAPAHAKP